MYFQTFQPHPKWERLFGGKYGEDTLGHARWGTAASHS